MVAEVFQNIRVLWDEEGKNNWPNRISLARILITPLILFLMNINQITLAVILFIPTAFSDGIDGFLARKLDQETRFGRWLDPLADKIFALALITSLVITGGLWLISALMIYVREIGIIYGRIRYFNSENESTVQVDVWGKIKTIAQYFCIGLAIINWEYFNWAMLLVAIYTMISGLKYLWNVLKA